MNDNPTWECTDGLEPEMDRTDADTTWIDSVDALREWLKSFVSLEPRKLFVEPSRRSLFVIGIGGEFAGVSFYKDTRTAASVEAAPAELCSQESMWFVSEGEPSEVEPQFLMPPELAIDIVCEYYETEQLSSRVQWVR